MIPLTDYEKLRSPVWHVAAYLNSATASLRSKHPESTATPRLIGNTLLMQGYGKIATFYTKRDSSGIVKYGVTEFQTGRSNHLPQPHVTHASMFPHEVLVSADSVTLKIKDFPDLVVTASGVTTKESTKRLYELTGVVFLRLPDGSITFPTMEEGMIPKPCYGKKIPYQEVLDAEGVPYYAFEEELYALV